MVINRKSFLQHLVTPALIATALASPVRGEEALQEQIDALKSEVETLRALVLELQTTYQANFSESFSEDDPEFPVPTLDDVLGSILESAIDGVVGVEQKVLTVNSWSISEQEINYGRAADITVDLENIGLQEIVMLDAVVGFNDRLGTYIASIELPTDLTIAVGQSVTTENFYRGGELERLININPDYVDVVLKVDNILFADGSTLVAVGD